MGGKNQREKEKEGSAVTWCSRTGCCVILTEMLSSFGTHKLTQTHKLTALRRNTHWMYDNQHGRT